MKFIIVFLTPFLILSQDISEKQRLKNAIDTTTIVSEKIQFYADISWEYILEENDSALFYADKALSFSKNNNYPLGEAIALETKGLYEEIVTGNYDLASTYYFEGIKLCEENKLDYATSIYHSLGVMFHTSDNYEKAKEYYTIAYNRAKAENNILLQKKCLVNLGAIQSSLKNYKKAEAILKESLTLNIRKDFDYSTYANLGNLYLRQKQYKKALPYLEKASEQHIDNTDSEENLHFLINAKTALKDSTKINQILKRAIAFTETSAPKRAKSLMLMAISNYYRQFKNYEKAFDYRDQYLKVYEAIKEGQRDQTVYNLETKYQTEKVQRQLEKELSAQKLLYIIIGSIGVLLTLISFFLYKNKKKNNQISNALEEKEILLKEIHHRVKNNLQVISSLLSLQQRQIKDPLAQQAIQEGRNRVKAMALIHQNLYQDKNLVGVETKIYIDRLVNSLITNYEIEKKTINVRTDIDAIKLDIDTIIPLGLIINELISNILKYAFINTETGKITISLKLIDNLLQLKVTDNGIGFPKDFSIDNSNSLGYRLVKAFSQKLKATLTIEKPKKGTAIRIEISNFKTLKNAKN